MKAIGRFNIEVNLELVNRVHKEKLNKWRSKPLARPESYLSRLLSAVKRLPSPIESMTTPEIESHIRSLSLTDSSRFETVRAINEVLKALGRVTIVNPRPLHEEEVAHIPLDLFLKKLKKIDNEPFKLYLASLYGTGCRFGELPMLRVQDDWAFISQQLRDDGRKWRTKNGKQRHAAILPPLKELVMAYKALPDKTQADLRLTEYNRLYGLCRRQMGVNLHALRHSYAIECAKMGRSVEEIASWIGDTVWVAKKHYIGYLKPTKSPW